MFGRVVYDRQNVFLNGNQVSGVLSFDSSIDFPVRPISIMGTGYLVPDIEGDVERVFNFSMVSSAAERPILSLLDSDLTGTFTYNPSYFGTDKRWINIRSRMASYELNCSVGEIPNANYSFLTMGLAGAINDSITLTTGNMDGLTVVRPGDLVFSGDNLFNTNRLQDMSYRFTIPWNLRTYIGSGFDRFANLSQPVTVEVDFTMDLDDATSGVASTGLCEQEFNGCFTFNRCDEEIRRLYISGAQLTNFTINGSVGPSASIKASYRAYLNDLSVLKGWSFGGINQAYHPNIVVSAESVLFERASGTYVWDEAILISGIFNGAYVSSLNVAPVGTLPTDPNDCVLYYHLTEDLWYLSSVSTQLAHNSVLIGAWTDLDDGDLPTPPIVAYE